MAAWIKGLVGYGAGDAVNPVPRRQGLGTSGPVRRRWRVLQSALAGVAVTYEDLLAHTVEAWSRDVIPLDPQGCWGSSRSGHAGFFGGFGGSDNEEEDFGLLFVDHQ